MKYDINGEREVAIEEDMFWLNNLPGRQSEPRHFVGRREQMLRYPITGRVEMFPRLVSFQEARQFGGVGITEVVGTFAPTRTFTVHEDYCQ